MTNFKHISQNTFLGRLLSTDPRMGFVVAILLIVYLFIHIFRLEMYPLYMYAMFSKQETPRELYHVYKLYDRNQEIKLDNWSYKRYTVLMNTINQYDDIMSNNMSHPEAQTIDKFVERLNLNNTGLKSALKSSFNFSKIELKEKVGIWVSGILKIEPQDLRIEKVSFNWDKSTPRFNTKVILHGMD